jgi:hypothetical protein
MTSAARAVPPRGAPLAMIVMLLAVWISGRMLVWESPFALAQVPLPAALAQGPTSGAAAIAIAPAGKVARSAQLPRLRPAQRERAPLLPPSGLASALEWGLAVAYPSLGRTGMRTVPVPAANLAAMDPGASKDDRLPFLPPAPSGEHATGSAGGRWSMDAWGFWRQGSDAAPISQGRVPIYGASQIGALAQYRLAPGARRDPRLYARAYRALVPRGESELALGASARPVPQVPLRLFGELRLTDGAIRTQTRPAAFAVTEIAPVALPLGTRLETYVQGGWVGGNDPTLFIDGQASLTREITALAGHSGDRLRFSLGAGVWGGAQEGAHRVDIGPTLRLDLAIGAVPARVSLDWRERVGGDAGPESGLAVTLATSF